MILEVENLIKSFGKKTVLNNLSFKLNPGITAVVGHNGAGKSTLFSILCGRVSKYGGTIKELELNEQLDFSQSHRNILFEESFFYPHLTAKENLIYLNYCHGGKLSEKDIDNLMKEWDVCTDKNKPVSHYSLGMKKRYSIAAAMINGPEMIILDEPMNGLDIDAQGLIVKFMEKYKKENKIVLFSSHQMESVVSLADRVIILNNGKIKLDCPIKDLQKHTDIVVVKADKKEILPFVENSYMSYEESNSDLISIKIKSNRIYDFLKVVIENSLHIYKMETLLPSLVDILNEIEVKDK